MKNYRFLIFWQLEKLGSAQLRKKIVLKVWKVVQTSAKCLKEISVPDLYGVSNSIQTRGMYIIWFLKSFEN